MDSPTARVDHFRAPALYVLNAASLGKPNAIQQLTAELGGYAIDVAVISETHLKRKHTDNIDIDIQYRWLSIISRR